MLEDFSDSVNTADLALLSSNLPLIVSLTDKQLSAERLLNLGTTSLFVRGSQVAESLRSQFRGLFLHPNTILDLTG